MSIPTKDDHLPQFNRDGNNLASSDGNARTPIRIWYVTPHDRNSPPSNLLLTPLLTITPHTLLLTSDILKHSPNLHSSRERSMSLDFSATSSPHHLYQPDIDFSSLHPNNDLPTPHSHSNPHNPPMSNHQDSLDVSEHPSYDLFSNGGHSSGSLASHRYRANGSSPSLGHTYSMNVDGIYPQSSFNESLPPFHQSASNPYDMMGSLPSSYSSGKPSPLTPSDAIGGLPPPSGYSFQNGNGASKDYHSHHSFPDVLGSRLSDVGHGSYRSEFTGAVPGDDYSSIGVNPALGLGFPPSNGHQYSAGRLQSESRYPPVIPPLSGSHLNHNADLMRGVAPHATHSNYRSEGGMPSYEDIPPFLASNPHDFRLASVDETISRLRLQTGATSDLQTFIRLARSALCLTRPQID